MPNTAFNPTRIAGRVLRQLRMNLVTDSIVNRNFEGEIEGPEDTVNIVELDALTINDYDPSTGITVETEPSGTPRSLSLPHKKYFAFIADLSDNAEQYLDQFADEGLQDLLRAAQQYVLSQYTDAAGGNQVTLDPSVTDPSATMEEKVADAGVILDDQEVPDNNRWICLPPTAVRLIEDQITDRGTELGDDAVQNGYQGMFRGFEVYKAPSSHFTNTGSSPEYLHAMYGHRQAITYADAVLNTRAQDSERYFGQQVDGLHVGVAKVIRPEAVGDFRIQQ